MSGGSRATGFYFEKDTGKQEVIAYGNAFELKHFYIVI